MCEGRKNERKNSGESLIVLVPLWRQNSVVFKPVFKTQRTQVYHRKELNETNRAKPAEIWTERKEVHNKREHNSLSWGIAVAGFIFNEYLSCVEYAFASDSSQITVHEHQIGLLIVFK